ncbi:DNA-processing protein DprA [Providencia sneebia]|uniref:Smf/DprA SLOG domain-containing protein n=1 Tax=Providencia sneebia DSM 19967 TaxID=1141660 RepID=K8W723_9GAMM|nr:DNA-processing protein DprA [Providencia sneebia]EKT55676.1 hypothetical protein OO7_11879 [Providencia sneebia DSM 19967]
MENHSDSIDYWKNEIVAFLALTSLKGVGYWTLRKIYESQLGFKELLKADSEEVLSRYLRIPLPKGVLWSEYQQKLWASGIERARNLKNNGVNLYFYDQPSFPESLKSISEPPYWIFVSGQLDNLKRKSVAIVGTRKPSIDGMFLTKILISSLNDLNLCTISGLATGIDQLCHTESIRYGIPTVAVLGNGIFVEFPKGASSISHEIIKNNGTIVTEYLPEQTYSSENFVRRNRIQAALCSVLFPVEWKIKSGTAHTVEYAFKYNKKIINIYLPKTYAERPELVFSEKNRGAISIELPKNITSVLSEISNEKKDAPAQQSLDF